MRIRVAILRCVHVVLGRGGLFRPLLAGKSRPGSGGGPAAAAVPTGRLGILLCPMTVAVPPASAHRRPLPPWPADRPLRKWQTAAIASLEEHEGDAFLASATPAAGKT